MSRPDGNAAAGGDVMELVSDQMSDEARLVGGRGARWVGFLLLADFAIVCTIKVRYGITSDICWMSHVGLLIAGLGFVCRSMLLICTALVSIFVLHLLWLVDWMVWMFAGEFVLGVTTYLEGAELSTWIATTHHFYLAPLLVIAVLRRKQCPRGSLPAAVALFLCLSLASRGFLTPTDNVNFAFRVDTSLDWVILDRVNRLPGPLYLFALNALVSVGFFLPTYTVFRYWGTRRNNRA